VHKKSNPMSANPSAPKVKGCFIWAGVVIGVATVIGLTAWWIWERNNERDLAYEREQKKKVIYTARIFPAHVTFQRGPVRDHDLHGAKPWRDTPGEWATTPDDSEGYDFAEFYQPGDAATFIARPFADETHPQVSRQAAYCFDEEAKPLLAKAIVLSESDFGKWKLRTTLVPTPHGASIMPENLSAPVLAQLGSSSAPDAPKQGEAYVDPRHAGTGGIRRGVTGKSPEQVRHEAEARAEREYRETRDRFDRHHHHFYLVEAARDLGGGRVVILRRFGQVFGPTTVTRATEIVQRMADSVELASP
jgi:hypothetical protein